MDVATDQLDRLIERRASSDPDEREESYMESVRRLHAHRRDQHRWEWVRYFDRLAANHARLAQENGARAEALLEAGLSIAHGRMIPAADVFRPAAWYHKSYPTFADALALVRKELWASTTFYGSPAQTDTVKVPRAFVERLTDAVCYAA